jgi:hypothetical protein
VRLRLTFVPPFCALSVARARGMADVVNNKLRAVKPSIRSWESSCFHARRDKVILTCLQTGHTRLTHGFLLRGEDAPMCAHCDSPLSVVHILIDCSFTKMQETETPRHHPGNTTRQPYFYEPSSSIFKLHTGA